MKTIVSERGQITLPKAVRVSLGLKAGTVLDIKVQGGQFVGEKEEPSDPILRWRGRGRLGGASSVDAYLKESRE
jgi:AbrB family looped-hinge helix DNA binding protein